MHTRFLALLVFAAPTARAADPDPASLYVVTTEGSSTALKVGQSGVFVLSIRTVAGAHISEDAPMRLTLSGSAGLTPGKSLLSRSDAKALPKAAGPAGEFCRTKANPSADAVPLRSK